MHLVVFQLEFRGRTCGLWWGNHVLWGDRVTGLSSALLCFAPHVRWLWLCGPIKGGWMLAKQRTKKDKTTSQVSSPRAPFPCSREAPPWSAHQPLGNERWSRTHFVLIENNSLVCKYLDKPSVTSRDFLHRKTIGKYSEFLWGVRPSDRYLYVFFDVSPFWERNVSGERRRSFHKKALNLLWFLLLSGAPFQCTQPTWSQGRLRGRWGGPLGQPCTHQA